MFSPRRVQAAILSTLGLACVGVVGCSATVRVPGQPEAPESSFTTEIAPIGATVVGVRGQLAAALAPEFTPGPWNARASQDRTRGLALSLYAKVAPATIVVRTAEGHGTGFFVDRSGLVVTNHHVVANARIDAESGARIVTLHVGKLLQDGTMEFVEKAYPGVVLKSDPAKDLALVKMTQLPEGMTSVPFLRLATKSPLIGSDVVAVGHPAAGMLWTARSCEVAAIGQWPKDYVDVLMPRLILSGSGTSDEEEIKKLLATEPPRKVVLTPCHVNPGDSGGPIVNADGDVVAVTFAMGRVSEDQNLDKFSYHVFVEEVSDFMLEIPSRPEVTPPSPWPPAAGGGLEDRDRDGKIDTLLFWVPPERLSGVLFDLDENSVVSSAREIAQSDEGRSRWDFEFSIVFLPSTAALYDRDNDGKLDAVLVDENADFKADAMIARDQSGIWKAASAGGRSLFDETLLPSSQRVRFRALRATFQR